MKYPMILGVFMLGMSFSALAEDITVAAASSLSDAFKDLAGQFEQQYPQTKVKLTFASSGTLLQQMRHGAPIDVLATADDQTMNDAQKLALIKANTRVNFASNQLVLIAPSHSTLQIKALNELNQPAVKRIAIGNPAHTPAGRYAQASLQQQQQWQGLQAKLIKAQNVRQALDYVVRGETQTGFVFASDVISAKQKVRVLMTVPTTPIHYPIAVGAQSKAATQASQFIKFINGEAGKQTLRRYGFKV